MTIQTVNEMKNAIARCREIETQLETNPLNDYILESELNELLEAIHKVYNIARKCELGLKLVKGGIQ